MRRLRPRVLHGAAAILFAGSALSFVAPPAVLAAQQPQPTGQADKGTTTTSLPADTAAPFRITGMVMDSVSKVPVPNAVLSIAPMTTVRRSVQVASRRGRRRPQGQTATTTSDATGHFELETPTAGGWALTAAARGYRTQALDEHDGYSTAVVVTESAPTIDVTFRLTPASIIQGYIFDEAGEAVRSAQVVLSYIPAASPENQHPKPQVREQQMTDDRGFYKFSGNGPGSYLIRVSAHPWYATNAPGQRFMLNDVVPDDSAAQGPDPLDVVYPTMWYPGVTDPSAATVIVLHGGETQEANLRLLPMPGFHLRIPQPEAQVEPEPQGGSTGPRFLRNPPQVTYLTQVLPDGTEEPQPSPMRTDAQGNVDIAGLVPGTYLVHQQDASRQSTNMSTLQIGPNSAQTVTLTDGIPATTVTVQLDPAVDSDSVQIMFRDLDTGHENFAQREDTFRQTTQRRRLQNDGSQADKGEPHPERKVTLAAGRYEVSLNGQGDLHLNSIEATGATATGRTVTIGGGAPKLVLHTASGRGLLTGVVTFHGGPDAGAMVLLIPATFGDPAGIDMPVRDQSNSDGSFELSGVLPGGYILVAIDHGWDVNWNDPSTLRRYLMHGVALNIKTSAELKEKIEAVAP